MAARKKGKNGHGRKPGRTALERLEATLKKRFDSIDARFNAVEARFNTRFDELEQVFGDRFTHIDWEIGKLKEDLAAGEHRLGTRFDNHFDALNREVGAALQRQETRLEALEAKP